MLAREKRMNTSNPVRRFLSGVALIAAGLLNLLAEADARDVVLGRKR